MRRLPLENISRSRRTLKFVNFNSSRRLKALASRAESSRSLLLVLLVLASFRASGASVSLAWDPPTGTGPSGYFVYYGPAAGDYKTKIDAGNATFCMVPGLVEGETYHFAATSYDAARTESGFSNDISATTPYGPPAADFTAGATFGSAPLALNFVNSSTGSITGYAWTFGDGATSRAANPVHVYSVAGTYTITLTVTGPGGVASQTCMDCVTVGRSDGWLQRGPAAALDALEDLRTRARQSRAFPHAVAPASR